jgi:diguanylate cyclase (GGDEF)-like protein
MASIVRHFTATIEPAWLAITVCVFAGLVVAVLLVRLFASRARLEAMNAELERVARIDSLTGMYNRRHVEELLEGLLSAAKRHGSELAVLMIDVDGFKEVNDGRGRRAGDIALRQVATAIRSALRMEDSLGRWGGEEFLAVLPTTDAAGALVVARRLRKRVAASPARLGDGTGGSLTVTVGGAAWTEGDEVSDLLKRADSALELGKAGGRNTAVVPEASAAAPLD